MPLNNSIEKIDINASLNREAFFIFSTKIYNFEKITSFEISIIFSISSIYRLLS